MQEASARAHIDGLLAWWALAGVDEATGEEPVNWLRPQAQAPAAHATPAVAERAPGFPDSHTEFHDYLASAPDLPESVWPGPRILPRGPLVPRLMIIVDAPDPVARAGGDLFQPDAMRLLSRVTAAIGVPLDQCYLASLSLVSPPGGLIAGPDLAKLAQRMRHHIALVAPRSMIVLGDQAGRALISTETSGDAKNLPFVYHRDGTVEAVSLVHPRLMLGQPSAKAEAWRLLRRLIERWGQ